MLELVRWWMLPNLRSQMYRYVLPLPVSAILTQISFIQTHRHTTAGMRMETSKSSQTPSTSRHLKSLQMESLWVMERMHAQTLLSWNVQSMKICVCISHCVSACVSRISGKAGPTPAPGEVFTCRRFSVCVWVLCLLASCSFTLKQIDTHSLIDAYTCTRLGT